MRDVVSRHPSSNCDKLKGSLVLLGVCFTEIEGPLFNLYVGLHAAHRYLVSELIDFLEL